MELHPYLSLHSRHPTSVHGYISDTLALFPLSMRQSTLLLCNMHSSLPLSFATFKTAIIFWRHLAFTATILRRFTIIYIRRKLLRSSLKVPLWSENSQINGYTMAYDSGDIRYSETLRTMEILKIREQVRVNRLWSTVWIYP